MKQLIMFKSKKTGLLIIVGGAVVALVTIIYFVIPEYEEYRIGKIEIKMREVETQLSSTLVEKSYDVQEKYCVYPFADFTNGPLSCTFNKKLYFAINNDVGIENRVKKLQSIAATSGLSVMKQYPPSETFFKGDDPYKDAALTVFVTPKYTSGCQITYEYSSIRNLDQLINSVHIKKALLEAKNDLNGVLLISFTCNSSPNKPIYPVITR